MAQDQRKLDEIARELNRLGDAVAAAEEQLEAARIVRDEACLRAVRMGMQQKDAAAYAGVKKQWVNKLVKGSSTRS